MRAARRVAVVPVLLALAAGTSSCSGAASAATPTAPPGAVQPGAVQPGAIPAAAVRTVDWNNARSDVACPGLGAPAGSSTAVTLADGTATTIPLNWFGSPATRLDVHLVGAATGDLTGDGEPEQVVHLTCHPEESDGLADDLEVFGPGPKLLGRLILRNRYHSAFAPVVKQLAVTGGAVTGTASYWSATDPHCCSSITEPFSFSWDAAAGRFVER